MGKFVFIKGLRVFVVAKAKSPPVVAGAFLYLYFYYSESVETNMPTFKQKETVCYVDVTELSTDLGA